MGQPGQLIPYKQKGKFNLIIIIKWKISSHHFEIETSTKVPSLASCRHTHDDDMHQIVLSGHIHQLNYDYLQQNGVTNRKTGIIYEKVTHIVILLHTSTFSLKYIVKYAK